MAKFRQNVIFLNVPGISNPLAVRPETSDMSVYQQIFGQNEYGVLPQNVMPKFIIDGGANIGLCTVLWAHLFPEAVILAIEPEASNFEILKYNTMLFENITILQKGIWNKNTHLAINDRGLDKWGFVVEEVEEPTQNSICAVTISTLLAESGFDCIDILKLDIESAEKEVFMAGILPGYEDWIEKVGILIIELHDRMKEGCSTVFFEAIRKYDFIEYAHGENIILINRSLYPNVQLGFYHL